MTGSWFYCRVYDNEVRCLIRKVSGGWWKGECLEYGLICSDYTRHDCYNKLIRDIQDYYSFMVSHYGQDSNLWRHDPVRHYWFRRLCFNFIYWIGDE